MHLLLTALFLCATTAAAQGCAATPEAAARGTVGPSVAGGGSGYRVVDVQVDAVMKRVWFRVVRCGDAAAPAVLIPVSAPLRSSTVPVSLVDHAACGHSAVDAAQPMVIRAGEAVKAVLNTSAMHMTLDAVANQSGAADDVITLTLKRRAGQMADEPDHRIRGIVRADATVEVQP